MEKEWSIEKELSKLINKNQQKYAEQMWLEKLGSQLEESCGTNQTIHKKNSEYKQEKGSNKLRNYLPIKIVATKDDKLTATAVRERR